MLILLTTASMILALVMSVVAWRVSSAERRRSDARVEALARAIHASPVEEIRFRTEEPELSLRTEDARSGAAELFAQTAQPAGSGSRWGLALAVGAFAVASIAAITIVSGSDPSTSIAAAPAANPAPQAAPAPPPAPVPLELTSLEHERDGDQLTVRGVVRNPPSGAAMERLTAVVSIFTRDGNFLTSGHAAVASPSLIPGGESSFSVTIPGASDVGRYRVSFRADERVIPHVDKRVQP